MVYLGPNVYLLSHKQGVLSKCPRREVVGGGGGGVNGEGEGGAG